MSLTTSQVIVKSKSRNDRNVEAHTIRFGMVVFKATPAQFDTKLVYNVSIDLSSFFYCLSNLQGISVSVSQSQKVEKI